MTATDELRGYALSVRNVALRTTSLCHGARRDLLDSAVRMEQAADTIDAMLDRLYELQHVSCDSRWHELFGTIERAARTFADFCYDCDKGECNDCPLDRLTDFCIGYDDLLEWLRGDA